MNKTLTVIALSLAAACARADGFMPWTDVMKMYDKDHVGGVTMEASKDHELAKQFPGFAPWFADHFADLDTDHDGNVSVEELAAMMHKMQWTDKDMVNNFYKDKGFMPTNPANKQ